MNDFSYILHTGFGKELVKNIRNSVKDYTIKYYEIPTVLYLDPRSYLVLCNHFEKDEHPDLPFNYRNEFENKKIVVIPVNYELIWLSHFDTNSSVAQQYMACGSAYKY